MKLHSLILLACLIAATAAAQLPYRSSDADLLKEKRFQHLQVEDAVYWMDSTRGDLWKFNRTEMRWDFLGSPRRADTRRKGGFKLISLKPGELMILDTESGDAWWTDEVTWVVIDDPSTRIRKDKD